MNETIPAASPAGPSTSTPDDVWGVNRPPALPPTYPAPGSGPTSGSGSTAGPQHVDRAFSLLQRSPLRRDTRQGVLGGVGAGIARATGVSPAAVRVAAVVSALFFGVGIGAYLLAWALLPDGSGRTHVQQAVRDGRPGSLAVVGLATLPVLGMLVGILGTGWPLLLAVAVVALVVTKRKGHLSHPAHG